MTTDSELLEEMRNKLTIETDGCMQVAAIFNIKERAEELKELHRLADIGKKACYEFKKQYMFDLTLENFENVQLIITNRIDVDKELLEWAKEVE